MQRIRSALAEFEAMYTTLCTHSPEEFAELYEAFHGGYSARICERGAAGSTASISTQAIDHLRFVYARWNFGLKGTLLSDTDHYCVRVPLAGVSKTVDRQSGLAASSGEIAVFSAREGVETIAAPNNAALNLAIPRPFLSSCAMSLYQNEASQPLEFNARVPISTAQGAVLRSLFDHIVTYLVVAPGGLKNPLVASSLEEHVARTILSTIPHNYAKLDLADRAGITPRIVKRAEDFMHQHAGEPLTLAMICDHAGCSLRALQNAFKQFRSKTPISALRDIRLEQAHRDLKGDVDTITQIAFKWGFSNPGRFATLYRARYGESPSETSRLVSYPYGLGAGNWH